MGDPFLLACLRLLFLLSIILWGIDTLHESNLEQIGAMKVFWASQILGFVIFIYQLFIVYSVQAFFINGSDHFPGSLFLLNLLKVVTCFCSAWSKVLED